MPQPDDERQRTRLYLITPPAITASFADDLKRAFAGGDVAVLQLRLKDAEDDHVLRMGELIQPICAEHGVAFIVNDRPDLAKRLQADGVHIGQDDGGYEEARKAVGNGYVGVSCYDSRHLATDAAEAGADYVAFGAMYPTTTKTPKVIAPLELLTWWSEMTVVPCVAIGGITVETAPALVTAGADFLAVVSSVWQAEKGPEAAVKAFNSAIDRAFEAVLAK